MIPVSGIIKTDRLLMSVEEYHNNVKLIKEEMNRRGWGPHELDRQACAKGKRGNVTVAKVLDGYSAGSYSWWQCIEKTLGIKLAYHQPPKPGKTKKKESVQPKIDPNDPIVRDYVIRNLLRFGNAYVGIPKLKMHGAKTIQEELRKLGLETYYKKATISGGAIFYLIEKK